MKTIDNMECKDFLALKNGIYNDKLEEIDVEDDEQPKVIIVREEGNGYSIKILNSEDIYECKNYNEKGVFECLWFLNEKENNLTINIIGYMAFYLKVTMDNKIGYAKWDSEFEELPTQEFIDKLISGIKLTYENSGLKVISIEFCNKEEYEQNKSDKILEDIKW